MNNKMVDVRISIIKDLVKLAMKGEKITREKDFEMWVDEIKKSAVRAKIKYIQYEKGKLNV